MTQEQYFLMCEEMGWDPKEEEIPIEPSSLSHVVQQALLLFNILPDRIEGMGGTWLGKDFNSLSVFMDIYEIDERQEVLEYVLLIQREYSDYYSKQQKMKESRVKGRR